MSGRGTHEWLRVPFWHPDRWADNSGWRCKHCILYRPNVPSVLGVRLAALGLLLVALLSVNGLLALLFGWR